MGLNLMHESVSDVSAGEQHMLITVSGFGTRRRLTCLIVQLLRIEWRANLQ